MNTLLVIVIVMELGLLLLAYLKLRNTKEALKESNLRIESINKKIKPDDITRGLLRARNIISLNEKRTEKAEKDELRKIYFDLIAFKNVTESDQQNYVPLKTYREKRDRLLLLTDGLRIKSNTRDFDLVEIALVLKSIV